MSYTVQIISRLPNGLTSRHKRTFTSAEKLLKTSCLPYCLVKFQAETGEAKGVSKKRSGCQFFYAKNRNNNVYFNTAEYLVTTFVLRRNHTYHNEKSKYFKTICC